MHNLQLAAAVNNAFVIRKLDNNKQKTTLKALLANYSILFTKLQAHLVTY